MQLTIFVIGGTINYPGVISMRIVEKIKGNLKPDAERTIPDLIRRRRRERMAGIGFSILSFLFFVIGILSYNFLFLVGLLVFFSTLAIIEFIAALSSMITIQNINLLIYLKGLEQHGSVSN